MKPPVPKVGGSMPMSHHSTGFRNTVPDSRCNLLPAPVPIPAQARQVCDRMVTLLRHMLATDFPTCCDFGFLELYRRLLSLVDMYQHEVLCRYHQEKTCRAGCSHCCCHWVVDVNSFEAAIIAQHLRDYHPEAIPRIIHRLRDDFEHYVRLEAKVQEKRKDKPHLFHANSIDEEDLLLSCFYQLSRPCPLLDAAGLCMIYELRPLTCRMYMSFGDPNTCKPQHINHRPIGTYLLDIEGEAGDLIDDLHFKYMTFEGDAGLRSLLLKHLSETPASQLRSSITASRWQTA